MRILVVEDERQLCDDIAEDLELERYTVERCCDGLDAWERILVEPYDLVILDLNLPGMDGLDILRAVRREKPDLRVLILSARSSLANRIEGLDLGADDYLIKPFELEELEARVRSLLRRDFISRSAAVAAGPLVLDTQKREISVNEAPLPLTRKEFEILEHLMLHPDKTVSQEELLEHIWETDSNPFSHSVRVHISSLRRKLRESLGYDPIVTKIGQGYRLEVRV